MGRKEKNKPDPETPAEYWNPHLCPVCGHNEFDWGVLRGARFAQSNWSMASKAVHSRHCLRCGALQLFAERPKA